MAGMMLNMAGIANRFLAVIMFVTITVATAAAEDAFVSSIVDLPLMSSLSEDTGNGVVFDTPSGRIVEAYAFGPVSRSQVLGFYSSTLPQLGWTRTGKGIFRREGEILKLEFPKAAGNGGGKDLTVRFSLSPAK